MRPEIREYNFDWMLWRVFDSASKTIMGTEKEYRGLLDYIPYFRGPLDWIVKAGEPGEIFLKTAEQYLRNIINAHSSGKKICATTFCFSPAILYAMDVVPLVLEVLTTLGSIMLKRSTYDYMDYCCEVGFTDTSCSSQRGALGAYLAGLGEEIDFFICDTPGICDTNANAFAFTAAYSNKPFYQLNYPQTIGDSRTSQYHRDDFKGLIEFIEKQTGSRLDPEKLKSVLIEMEKQDRLLSEIEELQRLKPNPVPILYNVFFYAGRFTFAGTSGYTRFLESMLRVIMKNASEGRSGLHSGKERVRALMAYIDHYSLDFNFFRWLDEMGITHLGCLLSRYFPRSAPYMNEKSMQSSYSINTDTVEDMIDSFAQQNSMMPMVRTIRGPYDAPYMWLDDVMMLAEAYQADCIIYNGTPGCRNTWGMVRPFARDTESYGYPTHIMNTDAFDGRVESWDITRDRLDEFLRLRGLL